MPVKVASEWLNSCSGCEIAILNLGETLLDLLPQLDFVHIPVLMDHKHYGQLGDKKEIDIPAATVGLVSGGIRNEEHLEVALEMRKKCDILIALGTCATHGGIPALINSYTNKELYDDYYHTESTDPGGEVPTNGVPPLLDRCYALDEKIDVDIYLPGCPPHPDQIAHAILSLLSGDKVELPFKSVCDTCPTIRQGKGEIGEIKRFTESPEFNPDKPISEMRCLLEQGYLCAGPVTRAGCAGNTGEAPRCIAARVPCRGCYGPVRQEGNQLLDMLNALASNGVDISNIPDRDNLLRFSGAHNRLVSNKKGGM
ncbi:MAG: methyl viologen-reducing hydrogenase [Desulfobacter sp.]|nr:methyl viologen-reducing hydrogenase [Desulfobacter sp.]WDP86790.1 MAG: methyl viologen-reducing hydrogenase [Desulfobacter sp.]